MKDTVANGYILASVWGTPVNVTVYRVSSPIRARMHECMQLDTVMFVFTVLATIHVATYRDHIPYINLVI